MSVSSFASSAPENRSSSAPSLKKTNVGMELTPCFEDTGLAASTCVGIDRWFGTSRPNFAILEAEPKSSRRNVRRTLASKSGRRFEFRAGVGVDGVEVGRVAEAVAELGELGLHGHAGPAPAWNSTAGAGGPRRTSSLSSSVASTSIRPMFGRIDGSRRVLDARRETSRRSRRARAHGSRAEDVTPARGPRHAAQKSTTDSFFAATARPSSASVAMAVTRPPSICLRSSTEIVRPPLPLFIGLNSGIFSLSYLQPCIESCKAGSKLEQCIGFFT